MRLFAQIAAITLALLLFCFGTALATRYWLVLPKLRELQAQADRKDLRRVLLAIDGKKLQLAAIAYDHAVADDMYDHLSRRDDPHFIENRFPLAKFLNLNLDVIALFDRDGRLLEQRGIDARSQTILDCCAAPLPVAELQPYLLDLHSAHANTPIFDSGLLTTGNGPLVYAIAAVMRTDTDSDARGNLLVATPLDAELLRGISATTRSHLALEPVPPGAPAPQQALDKVVRDAHNRVTWILTDNRGRPVARLVLTLASRRTVVQLSWAPLLLGALVGLLSFLAFLALMQRLLRPIRAIDLHLQRVLRRGDYSLRLDSGLRNELGDISRDIDALLNHVQSQQNQLQQQAAEMQLLSYQDGLTGLANRRRFDQALADNWALAQRTQTPLALLMCDVDYFKSFNDHYGHQYGDEVLKHVADIIRRAVVRHSDLAARYGGEEFAVLLPDTSETGALRIAERLRQELNGAAIDHAPSPIGRWLTLSIGAASLVPNALQTPRELVRRADEALYASKAGGRDRVTPASTLP